MFPVVRVAKPKIPLSLALFDNSLFSVVMEEAKKAKGQTKGQTKGQAKGQAKKRVKVVENQKKGKKAKQKIPLVLLRSEEQDKPLSSKKEKDSTPDRGVVYLGRIPHGFYEKQMMGFFSQFGTVTRLRLSRNKKVYCLPVFLQLIFSRLGTQNTMLSSSLNTKKWQK